VVRKYQVVVEVGHQEDLLVAFLVALAHLVELMAFLLALADVVACLYIE
jgi:hypothetical protein